MKSNAPGNHDDPLRKVLKEWRADAPLPPRFQQGVWRRIECAHTPVISSVWAAIAHWIGTMLPRPALTASYVAVLLTFGVTVGWAQARQQTARVKDELGQRYIRALDPYQAPHR